MRCLGTELGVLTVETSLAHVFSVFNKDFLRPLYASTVSIPWDISAHKQARSLLSCGISPYQGRQAFINRPINGFFKILQ